MFFFLCKVLFSGFLQFNGNFVDAQNNSKYHDWAPFFSVQHAPGPPERLTPAAIMGTAMPGLKPPFLVDTAGISETGIQPATSRPVPSWQFPAKTDNGKDSPVEIPRELMSLLRFIKTYF